LFPEIKIMTRKIVAAFFLALSSVAAVSSQTNSVPNSVVNQNVAELRRQSFEKVWNTINEKHYDPTFGGVDWKKMREIYAPKAMAAKTSAEFYTVLREMVGELKLSHFGIFPAEAKIETVGGGGIIGAELKLIDGKPVISRVEKDSSAEKAGLKTGFVISKIDGKSVLDILGSLEKVLTQRNVGEKMKMVYRERTLAASIEGKPETIVKLEVLNAKDEPQIFSVKRYAPKFEMSEALGNFPAQEVIFQAKRLEGNIGYIRFNIWVVPQMTKIKQALREFADAKGMIFDLRGNPGGIGGLAAGVAGLLSKERASLGSMQGRETTMNFIVYPQANPFPGRVVILSDNGTGSTSEVFAAGMQELGRAKVIGETSAGAVLPSVFDTLPTGAIFQYPISNYRSPKNILIEGRGVVPDTEVKTTRQSLLESRDLTLEEAVRQILN